MIKLLVITSVFPNTKQPTFGVFVRERMFRVAQHCELKVIAPVPWFPLVRFVKKGYRPLVPYLEVQDGIEVYHPRFFNIPGIFKFLDGYFFFLSSLLTVWQVRKSFKFDIIDSHFVYPDGVGAFLLGRFFRKPVTITVRESSFQRMLKYPLQRQQIRFSLANATKVFTVSADLKRSVTDLGVPSRKVVVVPNGVDTMKFKPVDKNTARQELGLPLDRKIIISVGWLIERKGFHRLLYALPEIKKNFPDILYIIVGSAPSSNSYEPILKKVVDDLNLGENVFFAGSQPHDELYKWLSASDIFCLATSGEGWANVFLEAMACGLPVVTSRVGGNEEVVASEKYGTIFDIDDANDMVGALTTSLNKKWDIEGIVNYARSNNWDSKINILCKEFKLISSMSVLNHL